MNFKHMIPLLFIAAPALAQGPQGMSQQDMQNMMQAAQQMASCMAQIDQSEIKALEKRSKEMEAEIDSLCKEGKRDEAQQKAMAFGREIKDSPAMQQMKKCGEMVKGMKSMMPSMGIKDMEEEYKNKHVCDG